MKALGLPRDVVDDDLVWEALERAHLAMFLYESREGLDTAVGERGFRLSGGQRQRLGIARACTPGRNFLCLMKLRAPWIRRRNLPYCKPRGVGGDGHHNTVAHRLATVKRADEILYLHNGQVVARGNFDNVRRSVKDFDRQASLSGL